MNGVFRFLLQSTLVVILTGVDTMLSAEGLLPLPAVLLSLALLLIAVGYGLTAARNQRVPRGFQLTLLEILLVFAVLYAPTIIGMLLIAFVPDLLINLGPLAIYNSIVCVLVMLGCLLLGEERVLTRLAVICLVVYVLSVAFDLVSGGLLSVLVARPAGFMRNPNDGAFTIAALLIASLRWRQPTLRDLPLLAFAFAGIIPTLSRSGLLAWLLVTLSYFTAIVLAGHRWRLLLLLVLGLGAGGLAVALNEGLATTAIRNADSARRLTEIGELASGNTRSAVDDPRVLLFRHYLDLAAERPLLGYGPSFAVSGFGTPEAGQDDQGPHNAFLARYVDTGVIGLACLLLFFLFWLAFFFQYRSPAGLMYVVFLAFTGLFSHDLIDRKALLGILMVLGAQALLRQRSLLTAHTSNPS
ncbi:MAG TPA: O-antigen ligase family protein [Steroidobacteraceae bacterium]|jgi:O-antigen ligase|nr:O-antigen ligase family protein [Steroidobacteraceae bacterium]